MRSPSDLEDDLCAALDDVSVHPAPISSLVIRCAGLECLDVAIMGHARSNHSRLRSYHRNVALAGFLGITAVRWFMTWISDGITTSSTQIRREQKEKKMGNSKSGPEAAAEGVVEDVKGKVKEATGALTGHDELRREGRAQQDKAEAERDVARKEAEAEKARAAAKAHEAQQSSHQS